MEYSYSTTIQFLDAQGRKDTRSYSVRGGTVGEAMEAACAKFERAMRTMSRPMPEIVGIVVERDRA